MDQPKRCIPIDLSQLRARHSVAFLLRSEDLAGSPEVTASFVSWLESLPFTSGARRLRYLASRIITVRRAARPVVFAMGAHVITTGCGPVICDLVNKGIVTAVAMNGTAATHDVEMALLGLTSENVTDALAGGAFGIDTRVADFICASLLEGRHGPNSDPQLGLGALLGARLSNDPRAREDGRATRSVLATAWKAQIPATVHIAIGTDTIFMHPCINAAAIGDASHTDFRLVCSIVADLTEGVWCNIGSAIILPEMFLKAVAVAKNLGHALNDMVTANLDMLQHYHTTQDALSRPVEPGNFVELIGHHEIMLPLLRMAVLSQLASGMT